VTLRRVVLADDAIGSWVTEEGGRRPARPGEILGFERLADALRAHLRVPVEVSDRLPEPDAGTAVIVPVHMLRDVADGRHAVLAGADRSHALDTLERHRLAGAVEQTTWSRWQRAADEAPRAALTGRVEVGEAMGADMERRMPWASERYAPLASPRHPDLPAILAAYLEAYFENPPPD
jgi:hypothetical protein